METVNGNYIEEDDYIDYENYSQLSYYETGCEYVDLYAKGDFIGKITVYLDSEMNGRNYICINNEIIYLDTIEIINPEDEYGKEHW